MMLATENTMDTARRVHIVAVACLALAAITATHPSAASRGANVSQASPAATPVAATNSGRYLPPAESIGEGWVLVSTGVPEADPAIFVDAASAVYVGPDGARAVVMAWTNLPGRAAVQRSWEAIGLLYGELRFEVTGPKDADRDEELAAVPFPEGCVDARRVDGLDPLFGLPGGITQCTVGPDVTLLVVVSGTVGGLSGYAASDRVATLAAEAGSR